MPRKSVAKLTDSPEVTLAVYCGRKTSTQPQQPSTAAQNYTLFHYFITA